MLSHLRNLAGTALVAALALALAPGRALSQGDKEGPDKDKVSNDQPGRPLQMPAASPEAREAFDDFERFVRRGAWERATKALYAIPEDQAGRFVDGAEGFIIPVARKRRKALAGLSPEGQAAYRLFYDADAKKLLEEAEGPAEQAKLEKLYSAYFLTSVGDNAADRLGDLYFEQGEFDRAADCWLAVLRERTDSEIPPAQTGVKASLALAKAGRRADAETLRAEVLERYADETVTVTGRKGKASEFLKANDPPATTASADLGPPPTLAGAVPAAWQVRFGDAVTAGMTPAEELQWQSNALGVAVPAVVAEGANLYVNYMGHVFALDLASGKMLWRSASFHNLDVGSQDMGRMVEPGRYAVVAAPGFVWDLSRDPKDMNYMATPRLSCRRAENGEVVWRSSDMSDYSGLELSGLPVLARGTIYLAAKAPQTNGQEGSKQLVLAVRPRDGKVLWKTEVGTLRESQRYGFYGMSDPSPQPRLVCRGASVYLDTHAGVLARLDAESGALDWGYAYPTEPAASQSRFFFFFGGPMPLPAPTTAPSVPQVAGDALLVKGAKSERLCAVDPDRMKLVWDRPIAKGTRLLAVDDDTVYLGGPDLGALDRKTKALRWSVPLPGGSYDARLLVRAGGLWQLTPRGIFEVDAKTGRVRAIFRGDDTGSAGGDLVMTDRWLLAVSNRTISAYPRGGPAPAAAAAAMTTQTKGDR